MLFSIIFFINERKILKENFLVSLSLSFFVVVVIFIKKNQPKIFEIEIRRAEEIRWLLYKERERINEYFK